MLPLEVCLTLFGSLIENFVFSGPFSANLGSRSNDSSIDESGRGGGEGGRGGEMITMGAIGEYGWLFHMWVKIFWETSNRASQGIKEQGGYIFIGGKAKKRKVALFIPLGFFLSLATLNSYDVIKGVGLYPFFSPFSFLCVMRKCGDLHLIKVHVHAN